MIFVEKRFYILHAYFMESVEVLYSLVELIRKVRKYGSNRRHIEIPKDYFDDLQVDDKVVVIDKKTYDKLKLK